MPKGTFNGKLSDPQWRSERARKAARSRMSPEKLITALEERVDLLTEEDRLRLAMILAAPVPKPPQTVAGIKIGG